MTYSSAVRDAKFSWVLCTSWTIFSTCLQNNVTERNRPMSWKCTKTCLPSNIPLTIAVFTFVKTLWFSTPWLARPRCYQKQGSKLKGKYTSRLSTNIARNKGKIFLVSLPSIFKSFSYLQVENNYIYILQISDSGRIKPRWRIKDQLHVTCYFISLLMYLTCFGH